MTNEIKGGGSHELSTDINVITAEINAYQRVAGEAIFEIGRRLKHVRDDLKYGEYTPWLESIGMDRRRASEFIKVYVDFNGEDVRTFGHLGLRALYEIATMPEQSRTETHTIPSTGAEKTVDEMTVRELREVKAELKKTQEERDAERKEREQSEARAKQAERSEEIATQRLEEVEGREPTIEIRTEYVEVEVENTPHDYDSIKQRLEAYNDKFGDIENYDEHITATHRQDMIVAVMSLSQGVREFAKRYTYMNEYKPVIDNLDEESKQQYDEAIGALKAMAESFGYTKQGNASQVLDAEYSEIN